MCAELRSHGGALFLLTVSLAACMGQANPRTTVIISPRHESQMCTIEITYPAGSEKDPPGYCGLSHLVEHLMFDGTDKTSSGEFGYWIQAVGGTFQGSTGETRTVYVTTVPRNDLDLVLYMEADRRRSASIRNNDIQKEKDVVGQEIGTRQRSELEKLRALALESRLDTQTETCRPVGRLEDVKRIPAELVHSYYSREYERPSLIVVSGGCGQTRTRAKIRKTFRSLTLSFRYQPGETEIPSNVTERSPPRLTVNPETATAIEVVPLGPPYFPEWRAFAWLGEINEKSSIANQFYGRHPFALARKPEFRVQSKAGGDLGSITMQFESKAALDAFIRARPSLFESLVTKVADKDIETTRAAMILQNKAAWKNDASRAEMISQSWALYGWIYDPGTIMKIDSTVSREILRETSKWMDSDKATVNTILPVLTQKGR